MKLSRKTMILCSWLAVAAVAVLIFCFSAQNAEESSQVSRGFLQQTYGWFCKLFGIPCSTGSLWKFTAAWNHFVRKAAHFSIYALLGISCANALFQTLPHRLLSVFWAWPMGSIYAASDELHQYFVPGRSCQFSDMLLDSCGVAFGILCFLILLLFRRNITWSHNKPSKK